MKRQQPPHPRTTPRPVDKKQYIAMMLGLSALLLLLVTVFLFGRWYLTARLNNDPAESTPSSTTGLTEIPTRIPDASVVPERQNGSLSELPDSAFTRGQSVTFGVSDPFGLINPLYCSGDSDEEAVSLLFEPLLRIDREGLQELVLADSVFFDEANHTLKIRLRSDHIWRDGRSVDAKDVVFTYQCLIAPSYDGPLKGRFSDIASVKAGPVEEGMQTVLMTFQPDVHTMNGRLLTVGILKHDYYQVPADRVYEMGLKALPPEGSGSFEWAKSENGLRILTLRDGFAGDILEIRQVPVGSDDKFPLLLAGELDVVRHDWNSRIESRTDRLPGYSLFKANRTELYLLLPPDSGKKGLPADAGARLNLLKTANGQSSSPFTAVDSLVLSFFEGIEANEQQERTAMARLIAKRLEAAGQTVTLDPLNLPELAQRSVSGDFQLMLLPAAADNRLPVYTVLEDTRKGNPVNAIIVARTPQVILTSARLANLTINPFGAPFYANGTTYLDRIANVRILNPDGSRLNKEAP